MIPIESKIYFADVTKLKDKSLFDFYYTQMPLYRKAKIDKFLFEKDKLLSLGAGALLNIALKNENVELKDNEIFFGDNGKPFIDEKYNLKFNLSHAGTKVICAVAPFEIGCDAEEIAKSDCNIAKRYFTAEECNLIDSQPTEADKNIMFCRLWVLKESFMKITGEGFSKSLGSFSIRFNDDYICPVVNGEELPYRFKEYDFNDGYRYACCVPSGSDFPRSLFIDF